MKKSISMIKMMTTDDIISIFWNMAGLGIFYLINLFLIQDDLTEFFDGLFFMLVIINSNRMSYGKFGNYIDFGFCRKSFYHLQLVICVIKAFIYSVIRTLYQWGLVENYIKVFREYEEMGMIYHKIPILEIFLANMIMFILLNIIVLIGTTFIIYSKPLFGNVSPQMGIRINEKCRMEKWLGLGVGLILVVAVAMGLPASYQFQMTNGIESRLIYMAVMIIGIVVAGVVGRKRFTPKYI